MPQGIPTSLLDPLLFRHILHIITLEYSFSYNAYTQSGPALQDFCGYIRTFSCSSPLPLSIPFPSPHLPLFPALSPPLSLLPSRFFAFRPVMVSLNKFFTCTRSQVSFSSISKQKSALWLFSTADFISRDVPVLKFCQHWQTNGRVEAFLALTVLRLLFFCPWLSQ